MPRVMGKYTLPTSIALTTGFNMFIIFKGSNTLSPSKLFLHLLYSVLPKHIYFAEPKYITLPPGH